MRALVILNYTVNENISSGEVDVIEKLKDLYHLVFSVNNTNLYWTSLYSRNKTIVLEEAKDYKNDILHLLTDLGISNIDIVGYNTELEEVTDLALFLRANVITKEESTKVTIWRNLTYNVNETSLALCFKRGIDIRMYYNA